MPTTPISKLTALYAQLLNTRVFLGDPRLVVLQFGTNTPLQPLKATAPNTGQIGLETNLGRPHIISTQDLVVKIPRNLITYGQLRQPVLINNTTRARVVQILENKPMVYVVTFTVERDYGA